MTQAKLIEQRGVLEPALRRGQRLDRRDGRLKGGVQLHELAAGIAASLRRGDQPGASQLIQAGARLFGSGPLTAAVGMESLKLEEAALQAAQGRPQMNGHRAYPDDGWLE